MKIAAALVASMLLSVPSSSAQAAPPTYVGCGSRDSFGTSSRPRDCFLDWPDLPLATAVHLRRIHWRGWGSGTARARALMRTKTYDPWTSVTAVAFRRRSCGSFRVYTRVRVDFGRAMHTWRTPGCADIHIDD
jgi:hypothetical protein